MVVSLLVGCTESFDNPAPKKAVVMTPNTTIAQLKAMYSGGATVVEGDVIIGGKVISTDQYGNIYRSLYIEDATSGIEIKIGKSTLYNTYKLGQMVYVKAQHLVLGSYGTFISLGAPDPDPTDSYENSLIESQMWINMTIFEGAHGTPVIPKTINAFSEITPDMYGTLVTLKGMKYTPAVGAISTWALLNQSTPGGNAQNQTFTFPDGTHTMVVRTSNYAKFASEPVPAPNTIANLTGIITIFNGTIQLILNSLEGVQIQ